MELGQLIAHVTNIEETARLIIDLNHAPGIERAQCHGPILGAQRLEVGTYRAADIDRCLPASTAAYLVFRTQLAPALWSGGSLILPPRRYLGFARIRFAWLGLDSVTGHH